MELYNNEQWLEDIDEVLDIMPELTDLAGSSVLVTGSTGLICSALIEALARWNDTHEKKINILAAGRNQASIEARFASLIDRKWFEIVSYDAVSEGVQEDVVCDYIIHGAGNASPNKIMTEPVETMVGNFMGTYCLLEYAKQHHVKRVLYISSSEVYGRASHNSPFDIDDYGYVDILQPRSSYALGKRAAETLCVSYGAEWGIDSVIVRPGHIYGPTAQASDNRVSSMWAYAAARGENIIMKSDGEQIRSYCYVLDCVTAILKVLLWGTPMQAYNVSNKQSVISIKELARILAEVGRCSLRREMADVAEKKGFNPMQNSSLDASALYALGWRGLFDAKRGLLHTVEILRNLYQ